MDGSALRYRWRHTWPEKGEDFVCIDGDLQVGRIYWTHQAPGEPKAWRWSIYSLDLPHNMSLVSRCRGYIEGTPREAAAMLEAVYDEMLPRSQGVALPLEKVAPHYQRRGLPLPWQVRAQMARAFDGLDRFAAEDLHRPASPKNCGGTCMGLDFHRRRA